MPDGRVHQAATMALAGAVLWGGLLDSRLILVSFGAMTGLIVDPDLDLDGWSAAETRLKAIWRPLGWAWFALWWPYARLAAHRGLSHMPVVGTAGRAAYLLAFPVAVCLLLGLRLPWGAIGLWFGGLCLADCLHAGMDWVWSRVRHRRSA